MLLSNWSVDGVLEDCYAERYVPCNYASFLGLVQKLILIKFLSGGADRRYKSALSVLSLLNPLFFCLCFCNIYLWLCHVEIVYYNEPLCYASATAHATLLRRNLIPLTEKLVTSILEQQVFLLFSETKEQFEAEDTLEFCLNLLKKFATRSLVISTCQEPRN